MASFSIYATCCVSFGSYQDGKKTHFWGCGNLNNGLSAGRHLVALEAAQVIGGSNTGEIASAEHGVDRRHVGGNHGGVDVLMVDDDIAVWDDILCSCVANFEVGWGSGSSEDAGSQHSSQSRKAGEV